MPLPRYSNSLLYNLRITAGWFLLSNVLRLGVTIWATRRLSTEDFALLAIVLAIQGLVIGLTSFNMTSELVRAEKLDADDIAVSWTCDAFKNICIWFAVFLLAPLAAKWLHRPDAILPLRISATALLVTILISPRLVELRRAGKFGPLGIVDGVAAAGNAIVTITLVITFQNYWALVLAGVSTPLFQAAVSHILIPWRPCIRFDWAKAAPMARFGSILLLLTWIAAFREHGMVFLLSNSVSTDELGYFNRSLAFSLSLASVATGLFWRVAYPTYSTHNCEGRNVLGDAAVAQRWIFLVALPAVAVAVIGRNFWISLVLGDQWVPMAAVWSWLVVASSLLLANSPFEAAFQATRRERQVLLINGVSAAIQLLTTWILLPILGLTAAGVGVVAAICFSIVGFWIASWKHHGISPPA